jgi:hypothetical protein
LLILKVAIFMSADDWRTLSRMSWLQRLLATDQMAQVARARSSVWLNLTRSLPRTHRDDPACRYRRERLPAGDRPNMGPRHRVIGDTREQAPQFDRRGEFAVLREDGADRAGDGVGDQEHGPHDDAVRRAEQATLS